jgi:hypothetical protein
LLPIHRTCRPGNGSGYRGWPAFTPIRMFTCVHTASVSLLFDEE